MVRATTVVSLQIFDGNIQTLHNTYNVQTKLEIKVLLKRKGAKYNIQIKNYKILYKCMWVQSVTKLTEYLQARKKKLILVKRMTKIIKIIRIVNNLRKYVILMPGSFKKEYFEKVIIYVSN